MNVLESRDAKIFYVNTWIVFLLALPLNTLLIWLIKRRSPDVLKEYSRILMVVCIADLVTVTISFIIHPVDPPNRMFFTKYSFSRNFIFPKYYFSSKQANFG